MARIVEHKTKSEDAKLDYGFIWTQWLSTGDSVIASTWSSSEIEGDTNPITIEEDTLSGYTSSILASGGTLGNTYDLNCHIVTDEGREEDAVVKLTIV